MPIIHMTSEPEKAPAGAMNLRKLEEYSGQKLDNLWLYETHHGLCIRDYERNGYNDSDWYMVVWNEEKGGPETIEFASTRGWSYPCYGSKPDATPEVLAKYQAWEAEAERKYQAAQAEKRAKTPARGKTLKVVKGRKVPIGTVGVCIWTGAARYGYKVTERVGIKDASGNVHWTAMSNVEVVLSEEQGENGGAQ